VSFCANSHESTTIACTVLMLVSLAGCGQTLVFGERDGLNFAIRADSASQPPLEVNFGLDRTVGTIVPPAAQRDGRPAGEGINMFAGFQIDRDDTGTPTLLGLKLRVATQFASGAAAVAVAENPEVVNKIINIPPQGYARPIPPSIERSVEACSAALAKLSEPQKLALAIKLNLVQRSESLPPSTVNVRLRSYFNRASEDPQSFAEFTKVFDCGLRS